MTFCPSQMCSRLAQVSPEHGMDSPLPASAQLALPFSDSALGILGTKPVLGVLVRAPGLLGLCEWVHTPPCVRQIPQSGCGRSGAGSEGPAEKRACPHQLLLSCPAVLHTGKRWFIICPVAEHPAAEAPESSPPLPPSSLKPEAGPGRNSRNASPPAWQQHGSDPGTAWRDSCSRLTGQGCAPS